VNFKGGAGKIDEKDVTATFKGNAFTLKLGDKTLEGKYTVDTKAKPHTIDLQLEKDGKEMTMLAIYQIKGETLKVCHYEGEMGSKERPKEFVADKNTVLAEFKRDKK
jgi:uncharacterized protein (TIGR03067 family)